MRTTQDTQELVIEYDRTHPPGIFFDTNVWRGMSQEDIAVLERLHQQYGFRYHYSVINFVELASHLGDAPSERYPDPFQTFKSCFIRLRKLCEREILPSPEMEFLTRTALSHYIDPVWIPAREHVALAVELITNATHLAELTGEDDQESLARNEPRYVVKPSHYRMLRDVDGDSMRTVMEQVRQFKRPVTVNDELVRWFLRLAEFFLLIRASGGQINYDSMTQEEQERFMWGLTHGAGVIFQTHCTTLVKQTINTGRRIDPNDLYDMLQLLLLWNENCLFVTGEKSFFQYQIDNTRILWWNAFRTISYYPARQCHAEPTPDPLY